MTASLFLRDPQSGLIVTALTADVDHAGALTDRELAAKIAAGGWAVQVLRDFGLAVQQHKFLVMRGFGYGGSRRPPIV